METFAMIAANLFGGVLCLIVGLIVQTGKANFMIAGYNTMRNEEQAKWDAKTMSKFIGRVILMIPVAILLLACIPVVLGVFPVVSIIVSWIIFAVVISSGVVYMNRNSRFKHAK